ncbi:MAG: hypothetical protein AB1626_01880 [Candidatus Micrarchaeota archaeon]
MLQANATDWLPSLTPPLGGWESLLIAVILIVIAVLVFWRLKNFIINSVLGIVALFVLKLLGLQVAISIVNIVLVGLLGLLGLALIILLGLLGVSL